MTARRVRIRAVVLTVLVVVSMVATGAALTGTTVAQSNAADDVANSGGNGNGGSNGNGGGNGGSDAGGETSGSADHGASNGNSNPGGPNVAGGASNGNGGGATGEAGRPANDRGAGAANGAGRPADDRGAAGNRGGPGMADVVDKVSQATPDVAARAPIEDREPDTPGITVDPGPRTNTVSGVTLADESLRGTVDIKEYSELPPAVTESVAATVARDIAAARVANSSALNETTDVVTNQTVAGPETNETVDAGRNETVDVATNETRDVGTNETGDVAANESAATTRVNVVTVANISVFDENGQKASDAAATVRMNINATDVDTPEDTVVVHETDEGWETLDTTVEDATNETVRLAAETGGFSLFAVAEIRTDDDPETDSRLSDAANVTTAPTTNASDVTDDSTPGFGVWVTLAAIAGFVFVTRRTDR